MKKTPLYEKHCNLGAKMVDFYGWVLPVQYSGIIDEHKCVRSNAGIFDVSHMGEIIVNGKDSSDFLQMLLSVDIFSIKEHQAKYTLMCYPEGGIVDDLLVYKLGPQEYFLVVNASNVDKDYEWLLKHVKGDVVVKNVSSDFTQLSVQGPKAQSIVQKLIDSPLDEIGFYRFRNNVLIAGINSLISRTGYTGEDGFEIYVNPSSSVFIWDKIFEAGEEYGLKPVGLGARDTLRFEAAMPLYGNEHSAEISPLEAGLSKFVCFDKSYFIGKEALQKQLSAGIKRSIVGFEMIDRGIPRTHFEVVANDEKIGFVTSGNYSPTLGKNLGMALVKKEYAHEGTEFSVIIREKPLKAKTVSLPFYKKNARRK